MRTSRPKRRFHTVPRPPRLEEPRYLSNQRAWGNRVYAIYFDLDTELLEKQHHNASWQNGYDDIKRVLERHGFSRQQGSVYFGDEKVDPVRCVLAIQEVVKECRWFRSVVRDVRMLRIEENNDLMPAVGDFELDLRLPDAAAG